MVDPAIIAFILVGVVGGVAVVMSASADWELAHGLSDTTDKWSAPVIVRRYRPDAAGRRLAARESSVLVGHHYRPEPPGIEAPPGPGGEILVTYVRDVDP